MDLPHGLRDPDVTGAPARGVDRSIRTTALREWRQGWPVVLASLIGIVLSGTYIYATGLFIQPLEHEFGWSRAQITGGMTVVSLAGIFGSPLFGMLIDKFGTRVFAILGTVVFCAAIACLSLATPSIWMWWGLWVFVAAGSLCLQPTLWSAAVSSRFTDSRGLALAVTFCGTGIASTVTPMLANALITSWGWRGAYQALGAIYAVIALPIIWLCFHSAYDTRTRTPVVAKASTASLPGWSVQQGLRSRQFYQLAICALITTGVVVGFIVHLVPLLSAAGLERSVAARLAGILGIASIVGRLTVGYLFDRFSGPRIGMVSVGLPIIAAVILLAYPGDVRAAMFAVAFLGLAVGGEYDAVIYLSTRFFGLKHYGTLFGLVGSALLVGVGLGPFLAGWSFDVSKSYHLFLMAVIPLSVLSSLMLGTLGKYPQHH